MVVIDEVSLDIIGQILAIDDGFVYLYDLRPRPRDFYAIPLKMLGVIRRVGKKFENVTKVIIVADILTERQRTILATNVNKDIYLKADIVEINEMKFYDHQFDADEGTVLLLKYKTEE